MWPPPTHDARHVAVRQPQRPQTWPGIAGGAERSPENQRLETLTCAPQGHGHGHQCPQHARSSITCKQNSGFCSHRTVSHKQWLFLTAACDRETQQRLPHTSGDEDGFRGQEINPAT